MLQAMRGTLASDPQMQTRPDRYGCEHHCVNVKMLFRDASGTGEFHLLAIDDQADQLMRYKANDEVEFLGRLNVCPGLNRLSVTLVKLDESKTLVAATEKFLQDFVPPKVPLMDQIRHAEQQKVSADSQGKQPAKKAIQ